MPPVCPQGTANRDFRRSVERRRVDDPTPPPVAPKDLAEVPAVVARAGVKGQEGPETEYREGLLRSRTRSRSCRCRGGRRRHARLALGVGLTGKERCCSQCDGSCAQSTDEATSVDDQNPAVRSCNSLLIFSKPASCTDLGAPPAGRSNLPEKMLDADRRFSKPPPRGMEDRVADRCGDPWVRPRSRSARTDRRPRG